MKEITYDEYLNLNVKEQSNFTGVILDRAGLTQYLKFGQRHRDDGPAMFSTDGTQHYYQNGKRHRIDGPSIINPNGHIGYFIHGIQTTKEGMELYVSLMKLKGLL